MDKPKLPSRQGISLRRLMCHAPSFEKVYLSVPSLWSRGQTSGRSTGQTVGQPTVGLSWLWGSFSFIFSDDNLNAYRVVLLPYLTPTRSPASTRSNLLTRYHPCQTIRSKAYKALTHLLSSTQCAIARHVSLATIFWLR